MFNKTLLLVVGLLTVAGCGEPARVVESLPADAVPQGQLSSDGGQRQLDVDAVYSAFRTVAPHGTEVLRLASGSDEQTLLVKVSLDAFEPILLGGGQGVTTLQALESAHLVVGSGFVSQTNSLAPVGLLQIDGRTLSGLQVHGYTRILGVRPDTLGVVGHREFHTGMYDSALQVGPGVVEQGLLDITERDLTRVKYLRAFVATCDRVVLIGATQRPMHLFTLGQRLLEFMQAEDLACDEVVNLAGDREVVLAMASEDRSEQVYVGHPRTAKAALLGFKLR